MSENTLTRRKTMKLGAVVAGAGLASGAGVLLGSKPAFAISDKSFTAGDVGPLTSNNGLVTDVFLQPNLEVAWDGLDTEPASIDYQLWVDTPSTDGNSGTATSNMDGVGPQTQSSLTGLEGSATFTWPSQWSLISDGSWSKNDFKAPNNGRDTGTKTIGPIEVVLEATLTTTGGKTYSDTARTQFNVDTENQGAGFQGGGNAGTGGSA